MRILEGFARIVVSKCLAVTRPEPAELVLQWDFWWKWLASVHRQSFTAEANLFRDCMGDNYSAVDGMPPPIRRCPNWSKTWYKLKTVLISTRILYYFEVIMCTVNYLPVHQSVCENGVRPVYNQLGSSLTLVIYNFNRHNRLIWRSPTSWVIYLDT